LIDSDVNVRRKSSTPTARPPHFSQLQKIPFDVRTCVSGR